MKRLSRRNVLRGAGGIAVALPLLSDWARADGPLPKRFIASYVPNGVFTPQWFPTAGADERTFTLGPIHQPLVPYKDKCLFVQGIDMNVAIQGTGEMHQRGLGALLTGAKLNSGTFIGNDGSSAGWAKSKSIDQELAAMIGQTTRLGSLQLGVNAQERDVSGVMSYGGDAMPLLPQNDPKVTFRNLFMDGSPGPMLDATQARRKSVLDAVLSQISVVKRRMGAVDQQRLDAHFTKVRELERRVTALPPGTCPAPMPPGELQFLTEAAMPEVAKLQLDLTLLAFQCDLTRVVTIMWSDAKNHRGMPFLGINSSVHNITHYGDTDMGRLKLIDRDRWQMQQFAYILEGLKSVTDPNGQTLLDNTLVFQGSDVSRGNVHSHDDMPHLLAGGAGGWTMGRYVKFSGQQHNNLLVSILNAFGGTHTTWGDAAFCTGPLRGL
ncbi:MAG: DUF1552 domain-containing protein [Myxococcales bacterium]|nr:DUF1552 domain-containing protein [Myxococcales bacterium]